MAPGWSRAATAQLRQRSRIPLESVRRRTFRPGPPPAGHPPGRLLRHYGLRVTINTDNRLMSDTTVPGSSTSATSTKLSLQDDQEIIIRGSRAFMPVIARRPFWCRDQRELATTRIRRRGHWPGRLVESDPATTTPPASPATKPKLVFADLTGCCLRKSPGSWHPARVISATADLPYPRRSGRGVAAASAACRRFERPVSRFSTAASAVVAHPGAAHQAAGARSVERMSSHSVAFGAMPSGRRRIHSRAGTS